MGLPTDGYYYDSLGLLRTPDGLYATHRQYLEHSGEYKKVSMAVAQLGDVICFDWNDGPDCD